MTNQEILTKAIQKAVEGGWLNLSGNVNVTQLITKNRDDHLQYEIGGHFFGSVYEVIFNHDFARALFGEHECVKTDAMNREDSVMPDVLCEVCDDDGLQSWQYHLQMMVISDDPIAYLGANI